ncbi:MAG: PAS/PAC sensor hybrid histidine kinase [uncultured bacterium]|nr:MAG: PAS/PAC sensor hybrid histidine kinase [uncultured bacterium]
METVGLLAGGVAHDYNNKLAVIIGYAELALNSEISLQTVHIFLEEILKAAQLSASITRQLLTFARKQAIVPVVLDLNQTIESMLKMLRQTVGAEIDLAWRPEVCLHPVKMDPVQIDQILANLCVNARTAIAGIGKITIATGNVAFDELYCIENHGFSEGEYVMIEVSDSGCGMTREVLEQIFEPFFTTREIGQGTGLGLSTVDGIIKQNNGFINVFSEIGVGTTFSIYLPRYTGSMVDRQQENGEATVVGCGETVLIVEDEPALLPLIKMMLEKLGYRVLAVNSPIAAIELVQQQKDRIHLLITDVVMPKMNGCDLAKALQLSFPEMKILFMSGYSANALSLKGVKEGTMNFIQKPFSMKELADKVSKATVSSLSPVQNTNPQ